MAKMSGKSEKRRRCLSLKSVIFLKETWCVDVEREIGVSAPKQQVGLGNTLMMKPKGGSAVMKGEAG